jgi:hypothetical protein
MNPRHDNVGPTAQTLPNGVNLRSTIVVINMIKLAVSNANMGGVKIIG